MNQLEKSRAAIDAIDEQMVRLFEQRMQAVENVVAYKRQNGIATQDSGREQALIARNLSFLTEDRYKKSYLAFIQAILTISKDYQNEQRGTLAQDNE